MKPRLLDLFCGAGGCSVGYARAGFDVTGVDIEDHPAYPYGMYVADALKILTDATFLGGFDVIHASPPCQAYTAIQTSGHHPALIPTVRERLIAWGGTYVIENVEGARAAMRGPVLYCGAAFGLGAVCKDGRFRPLRRHRLFESNAALMSSGCACSHRQTVGVYGHGGNIPTQHGYAGNAAESREAMGIDWMKHSDVVQAIPPAYCEDIGTQLLHSLAVSA